MSRNRLPDGAVRKAANPSEPSLLGFSGVSP
jgi:hypothetical protein